MVTIHELADEQAYEAEVSQCIGVTGYHHWFFVSAVADAFNLRFQAYAVEADGEMLGVVPMLFRRRGPVSVVNYIPVGGIGPLIRGEALRAGRMRELLHAVDPMLRKHRAVMTEWRLSPGLNLDAEQLAMPGFAVSEKTIYVIPGSRSPEDCWKSMSQLRRRSVRQCESRGIFVTDSSMDEITQWVPGQISGTYENQGVQGIYRPAEARFITERLAMHPRMHWRTVKNAEGEVLAVTGNIVGDGRLDNWVMAGPNRSGISSHSLAYWDLMQWALPQGFTLDFGGAPNEGNRRFKTSASCETQTALSTTRIRYRPAYEAGRSLYNWLLARREASRSGQARPS